MEAHEGQADRGRRRQQGQERGLRKIPGRGDKIPGRGDKIPGRSCSHCSQGAQGINCKLRQTAGWFSMIEHKLFSWKIALGYKIFVLYYMNVLLPIGWYGIGWYGSL